MNNPTRPADIRGVALLEVLIALTIVAIVIGGFASIATVSIDSASEGRDRMFANWIALNDITEIRLEPSLPSVGTSSDTIDYAGAAWRIEREVEETPVENILRVNVSVFRAESEQGFSLVDLSGFLGPRAPAQLTLPDWAAYTPTSEDPATQSRPRQVPDFGTRRR